LTSYWKPRWDNTVLFGSYRELAYRIDLTVGSKAAFVVRISSGPGFSLELAHSSGPPGFKTAGDAPEAARVWLDNPACAEALSSLLAEHFSKIFITPATIAAHCDPANDDILPEGAQLGWCLSRIHLLWTSAPEHKRRSLTRAEFMG